MEYFIEAFLIGIGLSMDAFAVSVCKGLSMTRVNRRHCLIIGLFFGGFQALMPFSAGWWALPLPTMWRRWITGSPLFCWRILAAK